MARRQARFRYLGTVRRPRPSCSQYIMIVLIMATILYFSYIYHVAGGQRSNVVVVNKTEDRVSCTVDVQRAIPVLKNVYGDSMNKVLHVGPNTCSVVPELRKEENTEAWGVEPYGFNDTDSFCRTLVRRGIVRVSDLKYRLPYKEESFSHVIVSDTLEYFSSKYLNKTLPELMRVSSHGVIIFAGYPGDPVLQFPRYGRPAKFRSPSWWKRYFVQRKLEENDAAKTIFEEASMESSYKPSCQILHLKSGSSYH